MTLSGKVLCVRSRREGEVAEWSKAHAWKACRLATVSRVSNPCLTASPSIPTIPRNTYRSSDRPVYEKIRPNLYYNQLVGREPRFHLHITRPPSDQRHAGRVYGEHLMSRFNIRSRADWAMTHK